MTQRPFNLTHNDTTLTARQADTPEQIELQLADGANTISISLTAENAAALRAALLRFTSKRGTLIGECHLLPDPRNAKGPLNDRYFASATRVRVEIGPDRDGDYYAVALDGKGMYGGTWVSGECLEPVENIDTAFNGIVANIDDSGQP